MEEEKPERMIRTTVVELTDVPDGGGETRQRRKLGETMNINCKNLLLNEYTFIRILMRRRFYYSFTSSTV